MTTSSRYAPKCPVCGERETCRQCRAAEEQFSARDRLIRALELRLEILTNGLGMPRDPDAIRHYEILLKQARASAPSDPGVLLADQLQAVE